jgi:hypothetical protein
MTPELESAALHALLEAADVVIACGAQHARADDPHRFGSLPREFDRGEAARRLVIDYQTGGRVRVAMELHGLQGGEHRVAELFGITLQGPVDEGTH